MLSSSLHFLKKKKLGENATKCLNKATIIYVQKPIPHPGAQEPALVQAFPWFIITVAGDLLMINLGFWETDHLPLP